MFWSVEVSAGTRGIRRESRVGRDAGGVVCVRLGIGCGLRGILPCGASTLRAWLSLGHGTVLFARTGRIWLLCGSTSPPTAIPPWNPEAGGSNWSQQQR